MINTYKLFKVLDCPHISEKSSLYSKKNNTLVFKVSIKSNKRDIKLAVQNLFSMKVEKINIILVKGKKKKKGKYNISKSNWKKAYVKFKEGQNLDFINNIN